MSFVCNQGFLESVKNVAFVLLVYAAASHDVVNLFYSQASCTMSPCIFKNIALVCLMHLLLYPSMSMVLNIWPGGQNQSARVFKTARLMNFENTKLHKHFMFIVCMKTKVKNMELLLFIVNYGLIVPVSPA